MSESVLEVAGAIESQNHIKVGNLYRQHQSWLASWLARKLGCPDKDYHVASNGNLDIGVGIPRTVYGSIGLEF